VPRAACRVPRAACRVPRAACRVPRAACRVPRAACRWILSRCGSLSESFAWLVYRAMAIARRSDVGRAPTAADAQDFVLVDVV
ncbi:hypothetical protein, partial [Actinoplanes sp. NPDC049599]|uniref:hypothetical protein n=1 Tax=Actinoplanes sp. NPDC049599 TaxID=3363903 RepID=UPI0037A589F4